MKLTIIYDNEEYIGGFKAKWGFSCFIEIDDYRILFDTGGNSSILLGNMERVNINPKNIDNIFISHSHWDHIGGLVDLLLLNKKATLYIPFPLNELSELPTTYLNLLKSISRENRIVVVDKSRQIKDNVYSTGSLVNDEQALIIRTEKGLVIIVGCSHPGVDRILAATRRYGDIYALIGGLHGFNNFELLKEIDIICPTHCTKSKEEIHSLYPEKYIAGGVGKKIEI